MNPLELKVALYRHALWLKSNGVDGQKADFREQFLDNGEFRDANLQGVDFSGAILTSANFEGADLRGANFTGADLLKANFQHTEMYTFSFGSHFGFAHKGTQYEEGSYACIGWHGHSLKQWLKNWDSLAEILGFSETDATFYYDFLNLLYRRI